MGRKQKRKNRIKNENCPKLDLHGLTYEQARVRTEDFVLEKQYNLPVDIITGNSDRMKEVVKQVLNYYGFNFIEGDFYNRGYIKVTS